MAFQTQSYKTFISHSAASFFAGTFGLGEKCVSPLLLLRILGNIAKLHDL